MLFNSYIFIFIFLPFTLVGFYSLTNRRLQLSFLLAASIGFYCYWSTKLVFFLILTVVLDFYVAKAISTTFDQKKKKLLLLLSVCTNLAILGFFKYYNLFADSFNNAAEITGHNPHFLPVLNVILPIGISFYTFQSMSYVIDVYRKTSDAHSNLLSFASYVTLFPHQISGPLVRHNKIIPQLESPQTYVFHTDNFWRGCYFFVLGLSKKILIADLLALIVAPLVSNMSAASNLESILAILGYTMQLYFDFSGYSDMAVGLGLMLNIQFPQNFNSPYKARSITEFWKKWHISLSTWLRDYLYISLGGNRTTKFKTYRNLLLTMTIGGLWHGGSWTFVVWGFLHGLALSFERFLRNRKIDLLKYSSLKWLATFSLVSLGWIIFRSPDFLTCGLWMKKVFLLNSNLTWDLVSLPERYKDRFFIALGVALVAAFFFRNTWQMKLKPTLTNALTLGFLFALCLMYMGDESPFLYFQF